MLDESLDSTPSETPPPAPRRRRSRAAVDAPAEGVTTSGATPDADQAPTPGADPAPAPARRTRRPRTTAAKATAAAVDAAGEVAPADAAPLAPAPADVVPDGGAAAAEVAADAAQGRAGTADDVPGDVTVTERRPTGRTRRSAAQKAADGDAPATTVATRTARTGVARRSATATGVERRRRGPAAEVATTQAPVAEAPAPTDVTAETATVSVTPAPLATSGPSWVLVTSDEVTSIQGEPARSDTPDEDDAVAEIVEAVDEVVQADAPPHEYVIDTDAAVGGYVIVTDTVEASAPAPTGDEIDTDTTQTGYAIDITPAEDDVTETVDVDATDEDDDPIAARMRALAGEVAPRQRRARVRADDTLDDLAAAIAGGSGVVDLTEDEDDTDEESDEADDDGVHDATPRRRRRRRGGRRRRREPADTDESEDSDADEDETTADGTANGHEATDDADVPASDADEDTAEQEGTEGARRRRRRRRRRGEEVSSAEDDPTEVVVRVREPRARRTSSGSDQVTGIEGSTRLEAKRQRRREGRAAGRRRAPILSESEFLARRESVDRRMLVRQTDEYNQIAVLEDGVLVEHYVDRASATSLIGNVYLGRVQNVLPSMEAVFVDIGRGRNAILYAGEVDWDSLGTSDSPRRVEAVFKSGQTVLVQVTKDPVGAKGARLTSHVSIPGRYVVYAPAGHLSGISRKLPEHERARLKAILAEVVGETASVIIRTAAEGASEEELVRDVNRLRAQWEVIEKKVKQGPAPKLLYAEPDLTVRIVRDLFTEDFSSLVVNGNGSTEDAYETVKAYVDHVAPHLAERLSKWEGSDDIFAVNRIDEQIAKALERKVHLPSGGSLIIDRTEAMTVIDVNTGKYTGSGGNLEATVTSNNLEAAEEIVRQLRLRDIGGIIVIDFIDMVLPSNRDLLLRRLVECLGRDRTRHQVSEVTSLGLVQMTRKKLGTGLAESFTEVCEHCGGRGYIRHDEPVATQVPSDGGERSQRSRGRH